MALRDLRAASARPPVRRPTARRRRTARRPTRAKPVCSASVCVQHPDPLRPATRCAGRQRSDVPDYVDSRSDDDPRAQRYVAAGYRAAQPTRRRPTAATRRPDIYLDNAARRPLRLLHHRPARSSRHQPLRHLGATACSTTTTPGVPGQHARWRTSRSPRRTSTSTPSSSPTTSPRTAGSWRPPPPGSRTSSTTASTTTCSTSRSGPIPRRRGRIDKFGGLFHYGAWIFFRYLTERFPSSEGGMPTLVRELWRRLDDAPGAKKDEYSLQGVKQGAPEAQACR